MDRRLLIGLSIVLAASAIPSVASAQSANPDQVAIDHDEVPVDDLVAFILTADQWGDETLCETLGVDGDRYPVAPLIGCAAEGGEQQVCDLLLSDYPEYYTTLNCVTHPADEAVCEALGEGHFHSKSAVTCLVGFVSG